MSDNEVFQAPRWYSQDEVNQIREECAANLTRVADRLSEAADQIIALRGLRDRLEKALEPFANSDMRFAYETGHVESLDSCVAGVCDFTVGDLLDARAALDAIKEG